MLNGLLGTIESIADMSYFSDRAAHISDLAHCYLTRNAECCGGASQATVAETLRDDDERAYFHECVTTQLNALYVW